MRRPLAVLLGIVAITWLQFAIFPGHSWLQADTQIYAPILERLASPGLLSRDLVANHPNVAYTIYDEVTLFLHEAGRLDLRTALVWQQLLCRAGAVLGIFLIAKSAGTGDLPALVAAALVNLGAMLYGPAIPLVDLEPTPKGFAFGLVLLAIGLLSQRLPLLGGLAGGLALIYDPRVALPFWTVVLLALLFDRSLRPMLRPTITILAIFGLLLANLAQLQPGVAETQPLFEKMSPAITRILQFRTSYVWVSSWAPRLIWIYLGLWLSGLWATLRIWPSLTRLMRWFFVLLPLLGLCGVPVSYLLVEHEQWHMGAMIQPARALIFVLAFAFAACAIAGLQAAKMKQVPQAAFLLAIVAVCPFSSPRPAKAFLDSQVAAMADWAQSSTWGGSVFLFPDAHRELYPGAFRAEAQRAVWVDWETGKQSAYFDSFSDEWARRWHDTMEGTYSTARLKSFLTLPIDYYVVKRKDEIPGAEPVFATSDFLVYDAQKLRALTSSTWQKDCLECGSDPSGSPQQLVTLPALSINN